MKYSRRLLAFHEETYAEIKGQKELRGSLTIRIPQTIATYYIQRVLVKFQKSYPRVRFEFQGCTVQTLAQELSAGTIDLAFLLTESVQAASLQTEVLGFEELVLVTHAENPLVRKTSVSLQDLHGQVLLYARTDCDYPLKFQRMLADEKIKLATSLDFNSVEAVKQCLIAGLGFALIPTVAVRREVEAGALSILRSAEAPLEVAIIMVWHKDKWLSPTLDAFLEAVKESFKDTNRMTQQSVGSSRLLHNALEWGLEEGVVRFLCVITLTALKSCELRVASCSCLSTAVLFMCLRVSRRVMSNCPENLQVMSCE